MKRSGDWRRAVHSCSAAKLVALLVLAVGLGHPANAQRKPAPKLVPVYAPVKEEVEIKPVRRGEKARFEFAIRNTGAAPLSIDVKPNCSCTVPTYDRVIQPKQTGKIVAELNTLDLNGYVTKTLLITTNDPKRPKAGLYMITTVVSMAEILPADRVTLRVGDDGTATQELTIRLQPGETAEITSARSNMRFIVPRLEAQETPQGAGRVYRLTLEAQPFTPFGRSQARVTLATTSQVESEIRIAVACEKGIVSMPQSLYLGVVGTKLKEPMERTIALSKHGAPFDVRKVTCDDPAVRVSYSTIRRGEYYRISVRYAGGWSPGWVQRRIVVETDDARQPQIVIPLTARVSDNP